MSLKYIDKDGVATIVSGLTPGGELALGASTIRSGSFDITFDGTLGKEYNLTVTFSDPMPDNDYEVIFNYGGAWTGCSVYVSTKNTDTMRVAVTANHEYSGTRTIYYKAFKLYTVQHDIQNTEAISAIQAAMPSGAGSANKLVTTSQVNNALDGLDGRIDNLEDLVPTGASVSNQLATKADVALDATPTASSHKGVESGGVYEALNDKDITPTKNSTKSVTSGGIYNSENEIWKANGISGAKNYCKSLPIESGLTKGGVTMVRNNDGSFTFSGTCNSETGFTLGEVLERHDWAGYILSGCPTAGSASTFYLRRRITNSAGQFIRMDCDYGKGVVLTALEDGEYGTISMVIKNGQNMDGIIMRPMVRSPKDTDDTYVPYAMTNKELTDKKIDESLALNVYGSKNILKFPYATASKTENGLTFTVNSDGSVLITGQPTDTSIQTNFHLMLKDDIANTLESGVSYILSGCPEGGSYSKYRLEYSNWVNAGYEDLGEGVLIKKWNTSTYPNQKVNIRIEGAAILPEEGLLYKPMIRRAEVNDDTYVPFAMTNRELTNLAVVTRVTKVLDITADTWCHTGIALPTGDIRSGLHAIAVHIPDNCNGQYYPAVATLALLMPANGGTLLEQPTFVGGHSGNTGFADYKIAIFQRYSNPSYEPDPEWRGKMELYIKFPFTKASANVIVEIRRII